MTHVVIFPARIMEALVGLDGLTKWRRRLQTEMDDVLAVRDAR